MEIHRLNGRMNAQAQSAVAPARLDWRAVLADHDRWLRTVLFARLREREAVEEVMQEIALAVVKQDNSGQRSLEDPAKVSPWLYRVAVRQAMLYRRKCGRRKKLVSRIMEKLPPTDEDPRSRDPLDWLLADEQQRMVRIAMERLRAGDAEMLLLKYTQDWSYRQIADHLGVSESAVEARLHRARQRLRAELAAMNVIDVA